jgi:hypothetical protein
VIGTEILVGAVAVAAPSVADRQEAYQGRRPEAEAAQLAVGQIIELMQTDAAGLRRSHRTSWRWRRSR